MKLLDVVLERFARWLLRCGWAVLEYKRREIEGRLQLRRYRRFGVSKQELVDCRCSACEFALEHIS